MRITDVHFLARSISELASSPWRSGDWTVAFHGVIATRFALRFERGAAVFVSKERFDKARLPQEKGKPESRPSRMRAYELADLVPLRRVHPHYLGSVCPVIAFRCSSINP